MRVDYVLSVNLSLASSGHSRRCFVKSWPSIIVGSETMPLCDLSPESSKITGQLRRADRGLHGESARSISVSRPKQAATSDFWSALWEHFNSRPPAANANVVLIRSRVMEDCRHRRVLIRANRVRQSYAHRPSQSSDTSPMQYPHRVRNVLDSPWHNKKGLAIPIASPFWIENRGDRTPLELFMDGLAGWNAGLRRHFHGENG